MEEGLLPVSVGQTVKVKSPILKKVPVTASDKSSEDEKGVTVEDIIKGEKKLQVEGALHREAIDDENRKRGVAVQHDLPSGSDQYEDQGKKDSSNLLSKEIQEQRPSKNMKMPEPVDKEAYVPPIVCTESTQTEFMPILRENFTQTGLFGLVQEYRDINVQTDPAQLSGSGQYLDQGKKDYLSLSCKEIQGQQPPENMKMPEPVKKETAIPQNTGTGKLESKETCALSIKKKPALIYDKTTGQFEYIDDELKDKDVSFKDCERNIQDWQTDEL